MKKAKLLSIIGALAIIAAFSGCSSGGSSSVNTSNSEVKEPTIATTAAPAEATTEATTEKPTEAPTTAEPRIDTDVEEAEKNITVKAIPTEGDQLCVFITNNNNFVVDELEIEAVFYDKSGNPIDTDSDGHDMILPGATVVSGLDKPDNYDKFETNITVELGAHPSYKNHSDKIELTQNMSDDSVIVQVKNNDTVPIEEVELKAVFYKGNNIVEVSFDEDIRDLRAGKTETEKIRCYEKFDKVEVYLNQAHTFGL